MATTDSELKTEVENYIPDTHAALTSDEFDQAFTNAKRHLGVRLGVERDEFDFYTTSPREDALFWWTCVFCKVATGELDTGDIQVGAIDIEGLLANEDGEVVTWLRNALTSTRSVDSGGDNPFAVGITGVSREDREYPSQTYDRDGSGGGSTNDDLAGNL